MTSCEVCGRPVMETDRFCAYHQEAFEALSKTYEEWDRAYGGMEWYEYLSQVVEAEGTGRWVIEVAEILKEERAS
ncbi:MAG: hypothetical protein EAX95_01315 [Candidatus Thorarchaeota archaeon]|nr:hypothetical protein [Candidatus Thorarchaeota archaeon]